MREIGSNTPVTEDGITRRRFLMAAAGAGAAVLAAACAPGGPNRPNSSANQAPRAEGLADPTRRHHAEQVISTFENATTEIQYAYAKRLEDGRGITAGRSGFTSGTNDLLMVTKRYEAAAAGQPTPLTPYVPALETVNGTSSTEGLDGFEQAWSTASNTDPRLNTVQDEVYSELYFNPAMRIAGEQGIKSAAGQLIMLDSIIQHGEGAAESNLDGLPAMLAQYNASTDLRPADDEAAWLRGFMDVRRDHLVNPVNTETQDEWSRSVDRVNALQSFVDRDMMDLDTPLDWQVFGSYYRLEE